MKNPKTETITFSIYQFILKDQVFSVHDFDFIEEKSDWEYSIENDLIAVDRVIRKNYEDRFVTFSFSLHNRWPYSETVLLKEDNKIIEKDNPRLDNEIELTDQFFVILDSLNQRIYLSNRSKESHFKDFLQKNKITDYVIKPILSEEDFVKSIDSVKEISLTVEKSNIFTQMDSLSKSLSNEIYGYGADEATISFKYRKNSPIERLSDHIKGIIGNKVSYKNVTIVGRDSSDFEKIFNLDGVINKISISTPLHGDSKTINVDDMLQSFILRIKKYDERK